MKRFLFLTIASLFIFALSSKAVYAHTEDAPMIIDLLAGQINPVGSVRVWNDADTLYIQFVYTGPGCGFRKAHLQIDEGTWAENVLTRKGNPIPGQFERFKSNGCFTNVTFTYDLEDEGFTLDDHLYMAAHVAMDHDTYNTSRTAWGCGLNENNERENCYDFDGKSWATYFTYAVQGVEMPEAWPEGGTVTVAYEDLRLVPGIDWDYNDFVVEIDTIATFFGISMDRDLIQMDFVLRPVAKMAAFTHVLHLDANTFACNGTYELNHDGSLVKSGFYNDGTGIDLILIPNTGWAPNEVLLHFSFMGDCAFSFPRWDHNLYHGENLFYDPYLHVKNTSNNIHTADPRMLTVPAKWQWPTPDSNRICTLYPKVTNCYPGPPTFVPYWWIP